MLLGEGVFIVVVVGGMPLLLGLGSLLLLGVRRVGRGEGGLQ